MLLLLLPPPVEPEAAAAVDGEVGAELLKFGLHSTRFRVVVVELR